MLGSKFLDWSSPFFLCLERAHSFEPFTHSSVDTYLGHLLRHCVDPADTNSYSFHSFRIGFACALLAAGCPYDMIQALSRWRSAESVKIYARINPNDYTDWVQRALLQQTTSRTTARLPVIDAHDMIATFGMASHLFAQDPGSSS